MKNLLMISFLFFSTIPLFSDTLGDKDAQVEKDSTPILDNILEGMSKNDYAKYSRDFDDAMKEGLPESKFDPTQKQINSMFGNLKSKKYMGFLNKEKYTQIFWKGKFEKTQDDVLIQLTCSKRKDKIFVTGLWFK